MTVPTITALPTPPARNDAPADFASKADAFAAALPGFVTQANALAAFTDQRAGDSYTRASDAAASASAAQQALTDARLARDAAQAVANFKGAWSSLSGPLALPATVLHNGQIWSLLTNLANVAASEPGMTGDWLVQGGLDASNPADFTAARNSRYWLPATVTVTLPTTAGMPVGTFVELSKSRAATPLVQSADGVQISTMAGTDTSVLFDINARILLVWTGSIWEV